MKKVLTFVMLLLLCCTVKAITDFSSFRGVWSSDNAEAVITDSICIFFCKGDSAMAASLEIPTAGVSSKTVFTPDGTVLTTPDSLHLSISRSENGIVISGQSMRKVEDIITVKPYEMSQCNSKFDVGKCLQMWRLGAGYGLTDEIIYCEVNTNRHMFVYMVNQSMTYIRAAVTRNNNLGTLFFQNIRMMKNNNTGEFTMSILPHNYAITYNDIEIDNNKFQPNTCTFDSDGGIYWSLISYEPDLILLNGCGEEYQVKRPEIDPTCEYFEYVPYSEKDVFSHLQ